MTGKNKGRPVTVSAPDPISVRTNSPEGMRDWDLDVDQILTVVPTEGDRLDVIFKTVDEDPDGLPIHGIEVGETYVESLLCAFDWLPEHQDYGPIEYLLNRPRADAAE